MFRILKASQNFYQKFADSQGNYYQWIQELANQVDSQMQYMKVPFDKAVTDVVDYLIPELMEFQTSAWVLESSMNRDAYMSFKGFRQKGLNFYSSAIETIMTIALYAIEKDIEDMLSGQVNVEKSKRQAPLEEMRDMFNAPDYTNPEEAETISIDENSPEVTNTQKTQKYRISQ